MTKDNNFNFLRFFVAIGVLMGHVSTHMGIYAFGYDDSKAFYHIGIGFFFMLSGFLLYPSYVKRKERGESLGTFFERRFLRIAPSVYFITAASIIIFLAVGALSFNVFTEVTFWAWVASNLALFPIYNPDIFSHIGVGVLNGSLWTIFTFVAFYVLIPIIYFIEKKIGFKKLISVMLVLSVLFVVIQWWNESLPHENMIMKVYKVSPLPHLLFFSLGIFWTRYWKSVPKNMWLFIISLLSIFIFKGNLLGTKFVLGTLNDLIWVFPYTYALLWFGFYGFKVFKVFNRLEDLGMGIYIWHMVIINLFLYLGLHEISWLANELMYILVIVVTMVLAYISRVLVEKPALKLQSKNKASERKVTA